MTTTAPSTSEPAARLPIAALFGLSLAGFIALITESLPAGVLPEMSSTLNSSPSLTGQTVTVYAIGTAIGVIPLTVATTSWKRRDLLLLMLAIEVVAHVITAASTSIELTLIVRFCAGLSAGVLWALLGITATRIAPPGRQGQAIAIALGGVPVAFALGIPAGVLIASLVTWQAAFLACAAVTVLTMIWILATLPNLPGIPRQHRQTILEVLGMPGIKTILVVVAAYVIGHTVLYTYIAEFLDDAGLGGQVGWVLFTFGAMAIVSVVLVSTHIDRHLRPILIASTTTFAVAALVLALFSGTTVLVYLAAGSWGLAFGSSGSMFMTATVRVAGDAHEVGQSVMITVFDSSIAAGGLIGGVLLSLLGTDSLAWTCCGLLTVAAVIVLFGRRTFPPTT